MNRLLGRQTNLHLPTIWHKIKSRNSGNYLPYLSWPEKHINQIPDSRMACCCYLRGDATVHQVLQQLLVVVSQDVLRHAQDVQGRVGEILEPVLAPVHWTSRQLSAHSAFAIWFEKKKKKLHGKDVPMTVATTSKQRRGLFWNSFTKGKATRGRYSTSAKMAAQWDKEDKTLQRRQKHPCTNNDIIKPQKNDSVTTEYLQEKWVTTFAILSAVCGSWWDTCQGEWGRLNVGLCQSDCCMLHGSLGGTAKTSKQTSCRKDAEVNQRTWCKVPQQIRLYI